MLPGMGLLTVHDDERRREPGAAPRRTPGRVRRVLRSRTLAWVLALLVAGSAAGVAFVAIGDARRDADRLGSELAALRGESADASGMLADAVGRNEGLRTRLAKLRAEVAQLEASKVRTVVETETVTVTETVTEWIPNGEGITVEITGFEDLIEIHDVQLTHSYGYSDLIGIAVNTSDAAISYAQLGCSFLDKDGTLLASGIDNKQSWQPGQSWGFVCSAEVDATGGILRVDELS